MISIVICSVNPKLLNQLEQNIDQTIGVPYQLIAINNLNTGKGICEVYNDGAQQADFPIICFCHEDIRFLTLNWGEVLCKHFNSDNQIGLIGVAGGDTKGIIPNGWFTTFDTKYINISQGLSKLSINHIQEGLPEYNKTDKLPQKEVLTIDGVFMCTKKDIVRETKFDQELLKGFHGYDLDFSLQIHKQYKVIVIYDLLLHHLSEGSLNREWLLSTEMVTFKWKKNLPLSIRPLTAADYKSFHWKSFQVFLEHLLKLNFSVSELIQYFIKYSFTKYFDTRRFASLAKFLFHGIRKRADLQTNLNITSIKSYQP